MRFPHVKNPHHSLKRAEQRAPRLHCPCAHQSNHVDIPGPLRQGSRLEHRHREGRAPGYRRSQKARRRRRPLRRLTQHQLDRRRQPHRLLLHHGGRALPHRTTHQHLTSLPSPRRKAGHNHLPPSLPPEGGPCRISTLPPHLLPPHPLSLAAPPAPRAAPPPRFFITPGKTTQKTPLFPCIPCHPPL